MSIMTKKQTRLDNKRRAVSPVIGVILMVSITVMLSAVIATFVLDLAQGTGASPQAGITFETNTNTNEVRITVSSVGRADMLRIIDGSCTYADTAGDFTSRTLTNPSAGDSHTLTSCSPGDPIQIVATHNGNEAVVATHEY